MHLVMADTALWTRGNQYSGQEIWACRRSPTTTGNPVASDNCIKSHRLPGSVRQQKKKTTNLEKQARSIATHVTHAVEDSYIDSSCCNNKKFRSNQALLISFDCLKPNVGKFTTYTKKRGLRGSPRARAEIAKNEAHRDWPCIRRRHASAGLELLAPLPTGLG